MTGLKGLAVLIVLLAFVGKVDLTPRTRRERFSSSKPHFESKIEVATEEKPPYTVEELNSGFQGFIKEGDAFVYEGYLTVQFDFYIYELTKLSINLLHATATEYYNLKSKGLNAFRTEYGHRAVILFQSRLQKLEAQIQRCANLAYTFFSILPPGAQERKLTEEERYTVSQLINKTDNEELKKRFPVPNIATDESGKVKRFASLGQVIMRGIFKFLPKVVLYGSVGAAGQALANIGTASQEDVMDNRQVINYHAEHLAEIREKFNQTEGFKKDVIFELKKNNDDIFRNFKFILLQEQWSQRYRHFNDLAHELEKVLNVFSLALSNQLHFSKLNVIDPSLRSLLANQPAQPNQCESCSSCVCCSCCSCCFSYKVQFYVLYLQLQTN